MRFIADYILRGRMQAMLVASTLALLSLKMPPISIVSSAAIALVTLRKGSNEGLLVLLFSAVAAAVLGSLIIGNYQFAFGYGLVLWFPVWAISIVLREGRNLNLALDVSVLLGALMVIAFFVYFGDPGVMWNELLNSMIEPVLTLPDFPVEDVQKSINIISGYMTGIIAAGSVSSLLLGLMLARWWQAALFNPGGFRAEFLKLNTRPAIAVGSVLIVLIAFMGDNVLAQIAANISILLFVLYSFIGTAVAHVLITSLRAKRFLVPVFYLLIFVIPHVLLPVALIGFIDVWLNLRNRISNQTSA